LNNVQVGGRYSQSVSIRFLAKTTSALHRVRLCWIIPNSSEHAGYAAGNGGRYTYTLHTDSDGQPGEQLASTDGVDNEITANGRGNFPIIYFPSVTLESGHYYDIVIKNEDAHPTENFSSLDFLWNPEYVNQTPDVQVWISMWGDKYGMGYNGTLIGSPVALFYTNGVMQGYGDIAVGSSYPGGLECGWVYGFPQPLCQE
jgi:hypothetical protein